MKNFSRSTLFRKDIKLILSENLDETKKSQTLELINNQITDINHLELARISGPSLIDDIIFGLFFRNHYKLVYNHSFHTCFECHDMEKLISLLKENLPIKKLEWSVSKFHIEKDPKYLEREKRDCR